MTTDPSVNRPVFWLLWRERPSGSLVKSCPLMAKAVAGTASGKVMASLNLLS